MAKLYLSKVVLLAFLLTNFYTITAQNKTTCATHQLFQEFLKKNPRAVSIQQFEQALQQKIKQKQQAKLLEQNYVIPVVFHIIHNGENIGTGNNITTTLINSQLQQLNIDFANKVGTTWINPNTAANTQIQFCMARVTPTGETLATPGIDRINRNDKAFKSLPHEVDYIENIVKPATIWDPNKYFNIWVTAISGPAGYATPPALSTLDGLFEFETDFTAGVVVEYGSIGSVANPALQFGELGRTLTHEVGHFFGLRHIWGDGLDENGNPVQCGTDYCDDTPTQEQSTSQCPPLNPRPKSCNNIGNMFENHMDYTSDACKNTFTQGQKLRMQTVMENSPRRKDLATSPVCTIIPLSKSIAFSNFASKVTETVSQGTCPRYKEIKVALKVLGAAAGNATVTFTTLNGPKTISGKDYTITPAFVNYTNGDTEDKIITIKIFDDASVEGEEFFTIGYNITGTGVSAGIANQTHKIVITDDDLTPIINQFSTTIFTEDFGTVNKPTELKWDTYSLIDNEGKNLWTISENGGTGVQGLSAHITNGNGQPNNYNFGSTSDALLTSPIINESKEYKKFILSFKYKCNGEKLIDNFRDYGRIMYSLDGDKFYDLNDNNSTTVKLQGVNQMTNYSVTLPYFLNNKSFYLGFRWTNNNNNIGNNTGFTVDDIKVVADARKIENQPGQIKTTLLNKEEEIYFISPFDGDMIAKVENCSQDVGCTTAGLIQNGNGQININTTKGSFKRTEKVWRISPAVPNASAKYTATLYFTKQELETWGNKKLNLKILKIKEGINLNNIVNASDIEIIAPTKISENITKGYITYTGNFTGFSQFMLTDAAGILPIQQPLVLKANALSNTIILNWETATENNNKGFAIEKSEDGSVFTQIGWMGLNNSNQKQQYTYEDKQVKSGITYYYRLRQIDINNNEEISEVTIVKIDLEDPTIKIFPNPTTGIIKLKAPPTIKTADIEIYNAKGEKILSKQKVKFNDANIELNLSAHPSGIYTIVVTINNKKTTLSIAKL